MDRAHRLGQAREVLVDKLIMTLPGADRETVEQRIMVMQVRPPAWRGSERQDCLLRQGAICAGACRVYPCLRGG